MELSLSAQAVQAVYSLLSGALLGFGYDLVRALRHSAARKSSRAALDALYCIAAGFSLFVFALGPGDGRLRWFMLCCLGAGLAAYLLTLSRPICLFLYKLVNNLGKVLSKAADKLSIIRKIKKIEKNIFSKVRCGFKMLSNRRAKRRPGKYEGSKRREARKGRYDYSSGRGRPVSVRSGRSGRRRSGDREIQSDKGRAE